MWQGDGQDINKRLLTAAERRYIVAKTCLWHCQNSESVDRTAVQYIKLFVKMDYAGWILLECRTSPADRVAALKQQKACFEELVAQAAK